MSRAFVRESEDGAAGNLAERALSAHPNFVTTTGIAQIDAHLRALETARAAARAVDDMAAAARTERELRYWRQRRSSARLVVPSPAANVVRFGVWVTLRLGNGEQRSYRIVGEDEADPPAGTVSWVSPLGAALIGHVPGDVVQVMGHPAEILGLRSDESGSCD